MKGTIEKPITKLSELENDIGAGWPPKNYLDNADFTKYIYGAVAQKTPGGNIYTYNNNSSTYIIDRWHTIGDAGVSISYFRDFGRFRINNTEENTTTTAKSGIQQIIHWPTRIGLTEGDYTLVLQCGQCESTTVSIETGPSRMALGMDKTTYLVPVEKREYNGETYYLGILNVYLYFPYADYQHTYNTKITIHGTTPNPSDYFYLYSAGLYKGTYNTSNAPIPSIDIDEYNNYENTLARCKKYCQTFKGIMGYGVISGTSIYGTILHQPLEPLCGTVYASDDRDLPTLYLYDKIYAEDVTGKLYEISNCKIRRGPSPGMGFQDQYYSGIGSCFSGTVESGATSGFAFLETKTNNNVPAMAWIEYNPLKAK